MTVHEEVLVSELMTSKVETVSPDTTIAEFCRLSAVAGFTGAPVLDDEGKLVGIVSRTDVVRAMVLSGTDDSSPDYDDIVDLLSSRFVDLDEPRHPGGLTYVEEIMVRDVVTTTPDATVAEAAKLMCENRVHRLPVVSEGRLIGLLSSLDLMRHLAGEGPARERKNT
jgi:CBS domain-containing protein